MAKEKLKFKCRGNTVNCNRLNYTSLVRTFRYFKVSKFACVAHSMIHLSINNLDRFSIKRFSGILSASNSTSFRSRCSIIQLAFLYKTLTLATFPLKQTPSFYTEQKTPHPAETCINPSSSESCVDEPALGLSCDRLLPYFLYFPPC